MRDYVVRKIKVIHTSETAMGGVGVYQKNLSTMTSENVHQVFLVPEEHSEIMGEGAQIVTYKLGKRGPRGIVAQLVSLHKLVKAEKPDIIFFHSTFSLVALLFSKVLFPSSKLIYCPHGWAIEQYSGTLKLSFVRAIEGTIPSLADCVVNVSKNDLDLANKYGYRGKHVLVENAVPDVSHQRDRLRTNHTGIDLLFVGRFDRQKGLDILLKAFHQAKGAGANINLTVIGAAVREGGDASVKGQANFIGWTSREEIDDWYAAADALIVPSRWEGLPLVVPEALRNGTPVIVSKRSSMDHLIEEGVSGISFDLDVESLTQVLLSLNAADLEEMRAECRSLYERRYSMDRFYAEMAEIYDAIV